MIIEYFRTGTAGAGVTHRPEVILFPQPGESVWVDFDFIHPDRRSLIVFLVNGDPEFLRRQSQFNSQKFPGKLNSLTFEIISEREIPEHLEKSMVASRISHILKIIMLATSTHAAL